MATMPNFLTLCKAKTHAFKNLDLNTVLEPPDENGLCATKIICTIGPACQQVDSLCEMLEAGMSVARVDLTWGSLDFHMKSLENLQLAMRKTRRMCGIMVDTLGREVMVRRKVQLAADGWPQHEEGFVVKAGEAVIVGSDRSTASEADPGSCHPAGADGSQQSESAGWDGHARVLPVTYPRFHEMVEVGDMIYVGRYLACGAAGQGSLYLRVLMVDGNQVVCMAENDAALDGLLTVYHAERSREGLINFQNDLPLLSPYDHHCIKRISSMYDIDFLSLSYTRTAEDVRQARRLLKNMGVTDTRIVAKIESRQALFNVAGILWESDGVVISRGNLGLDCPPEKMAMIQKSLIQASNLLGRTAVLTRVVDTMASSPRPTRAEATDIANAVLDNIDAIMLGAETLRGKFPSDTVKTVVRICAEAEKVFDHQHHYEHLMNAAAEAVNTHHYTYAPHQPGTAPGTGLLTPTGVPLPLETDPISHNNSLTSPTTSGAPLDGTAISPNLPHPAYMFPPTPHPPKLPTQFRALGHNLPPSHHPIRPSDVILEADQATPFANHLAPVSSGTSDISRSISSGASGGIPSHPGQGAAVGSRDSKDAGSRAGHALKQGKENVGQDMGQKFGGVGKVPTDALPKSFSVWESVQTPKRQVTFDIPPENNSPQVYVPAVSSLDEASSGGFEDAREDTSFPDETGSAASGGSAANAAPAATSTNRTASARPGSKDGMGGAGDDEMNGRGAAGGGAFGSGSNLVHLDHSPEISPGGIGGMDGGALTGGQFSDGNVLNLQPFGSELWPAGEGPSHSAPPVPHPTPHPVPDPASHSSTWPPAGHLHSNTSGTADSTMATAGTAGTSSDAGDAHANIFGANGSLGMANGTVGADRADSTNAVYQYGTEARTGTRGWSSPVDHAVAPVGGGRAPGSAMHSSRSIYAQVAMQDVVGAMAACGGATWDEPPSLHIPPAPAAAPKLHHHQQGNLGGNLEYMAMQLRTPGGRGLSLTLPDPVETGDTDETSFPSAMSSPDHRKLEAIASAAVKTSDTTAAKLIVVYTHTGYTAQLVAKYRPSIPITTIVVPRLVSDGLKWHLSGRLSARQCLLTRGISPLLAESHNEEEMLEQMVFKAGMGGVVGPGDNVVVVQRVHEDYCVKVVQVDETGVGVKGSGVQGRGALLGLGMGNGEFQGLDTISEASNVVGGVVRGRGVRGPGGRNFGIGRGRLTGREFMGGRQFINTLSQLDEGMVAAAMAAQREDDLVEDLFGGAVTT